MPTWGRRSARSHAEVEPHHRRPPMGHAARVALAATAVLALVYLAAAVVLDEVAAHRLTGQVDVHLADVLADLVRQPPPPDGTPLFGAGQGDADDDVDGAPVLVWTAATAGGVVPAHQTAPALPAGSWNPSGVPTTATIGGTVFRLEAGRAAKGYFVVGQSMTADNHLLVELAEAEAVVAPLLLATAFVAALIIGVRAIKPVELARRRQLEFTADASHELRTPLTVIEAEVGLALGSRADPAGYRDVLVRVGAEGRRLRHIVEDLLWLARVDSAPPRPIDEPVDLWSIAEACAERFLAVAEERGTTLVVRQGAERCWVVAPPDWIDRLVGVLVDNACRFAGRGGSVNVAVTAVGSRVTLSVEDSGPGIPVERRSQLFDRFHREVDDHAGHGLGLAIADAVVQATGGRWSVGESVLGGARFDVSWRAR